MRGNLNKVRNFMGNANDFTYGWESCIFARHPGRQLVNFNSRARARAPYVQVRIVHFPGFYFNLADYIV